MAFFSSSFPRLFRGFLVVCLSPCDHPSFSPFEHFLFLFFSCLFILFFHFSFPCVSWHLCVCISLTPLYMCCVWLFSGVFGLSGSAFPLLSLFSLSSLIYAMHFLSSGWFVSEGSGGLSCAFCSWSGIMFRVRVNLAF
mgnify:CR=1 FL=1